MSLRNTYVKTVKELTEIFKNTYEADDLFFCDYTYVPNFHRFYFMNENDAKKLDMIIKLSS